MARANQARLNLQALRHNLAHARRLAPAAKVMAVVKANGYGHGAVTVAQALAPQADALAVATIDEAMELRAAGLVAPVLLLEGVFEASELDIAARENFWITIDNGQQLQWLEQARLPAPLRCWLKVDTGMHRLGVPAAETADFHQRLSACGNCQAEIVACTHFASADDLDSKQTNEQLALFEQATAGLGVLRSAANSPAVLGWPASHYDWIRPGYMLYGDSPFPAPHPNAAPLRPVMTLCSSVISLREVDAGESVGYGASWTAQRPSRIATVSIGYGDGYPRQAANGTPVLVRGQRAPLAGRVSMDMITVDVTDLPEVRLGDEVVLWGEGLPVGEIGAHAGTIGYELTTRMPARTPRVVIP
ncbi:alanine racemase [Seongchinamella sediminis]|uniref:Alanine racemase n=1 Tax=Seongchinamella sediminis TaxID=2283635 RepID=A0A3L7DWE0_9GAMM|nr:alanine racemase [Seongchinamella sediminis]RLQ21634.1 alanine racemase [Seongchinamella sediminis]